MKSEPYKIVEKVWGHEKWYSLTQNYCFKEIFIKKGFRTSLQYHVKKEETNLIVSGRVFVFLDKDGRKQSGIFEKGDFIHLKPGDIHRFEALEDLILHEASSKEVDDVVRIEDDYGRK